MEIGVNVTSSKVNGTVRNLKRNLTTSGADTAKVSADNKESKKRKERSKMQSLKLQLPNCLRNLRVQEADPHKTEI